MTRRVQHSMSPAVFRVASLLLASFPALCCTPSGEPRKQSETASGANPQVAASETGLGVVPAKPAGSAVPEGDSGTFTGTAGSLEKQRNGPARLLTAVRSAEHPSYDRVVFEFADGLPGFHLEYVDRPVRDCGSGDPRPIEGEGWLEVRLTPANAHTEAGNPTIATRELFPRLPIVREIERTCDFEAVVTWVLGTSSPNRYRVLELSNPARLVVDILHSQ